MKYQEPSPEEYLRIAEKVRSGEYFREARRMADVSIHDPMAERYFYLFVTALALFTFITALFAMQSLYPLSRTVPFVYMSDNVLDDVPSIVPLRQNTAQSVDEAVLLFLAKTFVTHYESYDIDKLERNYGGVQSAASPEVFAAYQRLMQTGNPESPVVKYQRHTVRTIRVLSAQVVPGAPGAVEVVYEATLANAEGGTKTLHRATLDVDYGGVVFDEKTDMVKPLSFNVKRYRSQIQEKT